MIAKASLGRFLARNPFPNGWTDGLFYREKMRAIHYVAPASLPPVARILEVGGGRSGLASYLYPDAQVTTLDIDLELGREQPGDAVSSFVCGDARALPFDDGSFDIVTLFDVLEHVVEDRRVAEEAFRVLRPGGQVLASTPAESWRYPFFGFMKRFTPPEAELMAEWGHVRRGYRVNELIALFNAVPDRSATFINPLTSLFHDISFSRLRRRYRMIVYALAAPMTALGYLCHRPTSRGSEHAFAWRR